ncbi:MULTISPECIES: hypothetical protein [Burkholderia cepacia complex]|uniref:hypothetical protein n=1 Tax=Burkholderia cepacia complex TaxID=87882 RepID=UPI001B9C20B3|nr:hypothetical protein [Burkholderia cenocepacia]MBR8319398.1 hypothetical protein [Burkholderia cenocepacia]MDR5665610.1 hypothetical protein [Burkholderia cenocepacia]MDR5668623.1 hypothetical protein [Burkholderia cenocepacia]MDR8096691.1 hypothetical protein [Burkholderia cenocepacia]
MEAIALLLLLAWLYCTFNLIQIPYTIFRMRRTPQKIGCLPAWGRLLRYAFIYAVTAPLPLLVTIALAGAGVSGSKAGGLESIMWFAWAALWLFLAVAAAALLIACLRPLLCRVLERPKRIAGEN